MKTKKKEKVAFKKQRFEEDIDICIQIPFQGTVVKYSNASS